MRGDHGALDEADRNANGTVATGDRVIEWAQEQLEVAWFAPGARFAESRSVVVDERSRNVLVVDEIVRR